MAMTDYSLEDELTRLEVQLYDANRAASELRKRISVLEKANAELEDEISDMVSRDQVDDLRSENKGHLEDIMVRDKSLQLLADHLGWSSLDLDMFLTSADPHGFLVAKVPR